MGTYPVTFYTTVITFCLLSVPEMCCYRFHCMSLRFTVTCSFELFSDTGKAYFNEHVGHMCEKFKQISFYTLKCVTFNAFEKGQVTNPWLNFSLLYKWLWKNIYLKISSQSIRCSSRTISFASLTCLCLSRELKSRPYSCNCNIHTLYCICVATWILPPCDQILKQ